MAAQRDSSGNLTHCFKALSRKSVTNLAMLAVSTSLGCAPAVEQAPPVDPATLNAAVDTLLSRSEAAWNGGDLEGFLFWYQRGPETTFLGSTGLTRGWDTIRARYAPRFEAGATRDSLRFEDLVSRPLAPRLGLATARYVLSRGDSVTASGVFTLIVEEKSEGWRIVHDHSSADSN